MKANKLRERAYKQGRANGAVLDNESYELMQRLSTIAEAPTNRSDGPDPVIHKGIYFDEESMELRYYDRERDEWIPFFRDHFRITTEMLTDDPTDNPVVGQLWINEDGFLFFYNGVEWVAMKTMEQAGNDINLAIFEDFLLMSPMNESGATVVDAVNKKQFLVPRISTGKMFIEGILSEDYEVVNRVTAQFDAERVNGNLTSWVHVNPGRLVAVHKTMFQVDKTGHFISHTANNTEFYGFKYESLGGKLLQPHKDYTPRKDGILLSTTKGVAYDFIVAIRYEFGWIRTSGDLEVITEKAKNTYAATGLSGGVAVFVDGYQLDEEQYIYDPVDDYLKITDEDFLEKDQEVMVISNIEHMESGIIRAHFKHDYAVIRLRNKYRNPVLFVNGEALHEGSDAGELIYDREQDRMMVTGAHPGMGYTVMDLVIPEIGDQPEIDAFVGSGFTETKDPTTNEGWIPVAEDFEIQNAILFIDGSTIPDESYVIVEDGGNKYLEVHDEEGNNLLDDDMRFILLNDVYNRLFTMSDKQSIVPTRGADMIIVYEDDLLRLDRDFMLTVDLDLVERIDGRIIGLYNEDESITYLHYSSYYEEWQELTPAEVEYVAKVTDYYRKAPHSVIFNKMSVSEKVRIYAYKMAATVQNPIIVGRFPALKKPDLLESVDADEAQDFRGEDTFYFDDHISYPPNKNALQVFVDGVRIYDVEEMSLGEGFILPKKVVGIVSYIIEKPIPGEIKTCDREILTHENALDHTNLYKTKEPLYPGYLTVYVSGIRMPKESYVLIDHHTILFKDTARALIGNSENYPVMNVLGLDGKLREMNVEVEDRILIEKRQTRVRNEESITFNKWADGVSIDVDDVGLNRDIIDAKDHLLFFLDGRFTSLQWNKEDYEILSSVGKILIHDVYYKMNIQDNPLIELIQDNPGMAARFNAITGKTIDDIERNHVLTIEWR